MRLKVIMHSLYISVENECITVTIMKIQLDIEATDCVTNLAQFQVTCSRFILCNTSEISRSSSIDCGV